MLSRVADSIYWMSRQVERAENLARFLEVTHNLILDQPDDLVQPWVPLISVTADNEEFLKRFTLMDADAVTQFLAFDETYANSMLSSLRQARENARGVRESLSTEVFEQINTFYRFVADAAKQDSLESPNEFFSTVRRIAIQWTGVLDSTMPRDIGWHFANVGRLLERADKTTRILDVKYYNILPQVDDVGTAVDDVQWSALLYAISGFEAYRRQHHMIIIPSVVEFFLCNRTFPRSVLFCVAGASESLAEIERFSREDSDHQAVEVAERLWRRLTECSVEDVIEGGMHNFIDELQSDLNEIGATMNADYFHAVT